MKHATKQTITRALTDGALTIKEIAAKTGLANATITRALTELGAVSDGYYGAKWTIDADALQSFTKTNKLPGVLSVKMEDSDEGILVSYAETPVYKWNRSIGRVAAALAEIVITPETDRADAAAQLRQLAGHCASLSHRLTETANDPAWFTTLEGIKPKEEEAS